MFSPKSVNVQSKISECSVQNQYNIDVRVKWDMHTGCGEETDDIFVVWGYFKTAPPQILTANVNEVKRKESAYKVIHMQNSQQKMGWGPPQMCSNHCDVL
jgi:hypothetical protein